MWNRAISLARAYWYGLSEPIKLRFLREPCFEPSPLISVVVPTHNRKTLLIERCLKSILAQTYKNFEVIVVAHGCTDGTVLAIQQYLPDPRIRVIQISRRETYPPTLENHWFAGRVIPTNAALKHVTGVWTAQNDDDDEWTPDHLEVLLRYAQTWGYEFVSAQHEKGQADGSFVVCSPYTYYRGKVPVEIGGVQTWLYRSYLNAFKWNPDCWRKSWNTVCDTDLQDRFFRAGVRMGYLKKVVTKVIPRPGENVVGLAAARANNVVYMNHLAFK